MTKIAKNGSVGALCSTFGGPWGHFWKVEQLFVFWSTLGRQKIDKNGKSVPGARSGAAPDLYFLFFLEIMVILVAILVPVGVPKS